ncbi:MAG: hypothetical protein ABIG95_06945 [Candidatus Woesearchaeota archaeon]
MVILFDQFNLPDNIYEVVFATTQQIVVAQLLVKYIKAHKGSVTKPEMSEFATKLHDGKVEHEGKKISYNKRQFYDRILTPMKSMGIIKYDLYKRTYSISDDFHKALLKLAHMWLEEFNL